jgi:uncharacterized phage protein gp47/JayE
MPWFTPTLRQVREMVRDDITGSLYGASFVGNNVLRVISDGMAGLAHLTLRYVDWLSLQLLPDTAEVEWLDRHGDIWLVNADGTVGRKMATYAVGIANFSGTGGAAVPSGTQFIYGNVGYEVTNNVIILADALTPGPVRALDAGTLGNRLIGESLSLTTPLAGVDPFAEVVRLDGGTETENDNDLRMRVLQRIRQPPMGGAEHDYVRWALAVPGVTRCWTVGNEMGPGTVTVRIMCDDLRAENDGFPYEEDCDRVAAYIDTVRPVTVKDLWVVSPIKQPIDLNILDLVPDTPDIRGAIEANVEEMLYNLAKPGQTIFAAWKSATVQNTPGVVSFELVNTDDDVMPSGGHMAVLGDIFYAISPA